MFLVSNIVSHQLTTTTTIWKDVLANDDISTLDDKGLITLVYPSEETSLRVKNRLEEIKSKGMASSAAYLNFTLIDSPCTY